MSKLYVCEEYETLYEEGYRVITTLKEHDEQIIAKTVDKCSELFAETLSNITNICGTNCPIKCNWGTEITCKDMCKKWFEEKLKEQK